MCATLMFLISSGERSPNCISWIERSGALENWKLRFAIFDSLNTRPKVAKEKKKKKAPDHH
jgi:hypothetical protein